MPTRIPPTKVELVDLAEQLKRRLGSASNRNRKSGLSVELRQDILTALDALCELAEEQSAEDVIPDETDQTPSHLDCDKLAANISSSVLQSLNQWRSDFLAQLTAGQPEPTVTHESISAPVINDAMLIERLEEMERELSDTQYQLAAANDQLADCQLDLKYSRQLLENADLRMSELELSSSPAVEPDSYDDSQLEQLQLQLEEALGQIAELQEQNSELASKLAQQTAQSITDNRISGRGCGEQLSWEERKLMILQQLEDDTSPACEQFSQEERLEIEEIIKASQAEIARRDEEIDELREIVRMQSDARAGLAIGAAGVAQLLDADDLLIQERQKLKEIQQEWEEKLRQAEIDLSMERAKIARERIAIEKQKEERAATDSGDNEPLSKERRWMRFLGLGEDPNGTAKG